MTLFQAKVFQATTRVPRGRVTTYAELARAISRPRVARAVGQALHYNPHAPSVPCHRVVRSDGRIGGYVNGENRKVALLRKEGVIVRRGRVDLCIYSFRTIVAKVYIKKNSRFWGARK